MTILEEVRSMQSQALADEQIIQILRDKGVPYRDIADALTQSKIKVAVEQNNNQEPQSMENPYMQQSEEMQPSIMNQAPMPMPPAEQQGEYYPPAPSPSFGPPQDYQYQDQYQQYPQYAQPQVSADMISEISAQVVAEKLSEIRKHLEKIIDLKTSFESKIE